MIEPALDQKSEESDAQLYLFLVVMLLKKLLCEVSVSGRADEGVVCWVFWWKRMETRAPAPMGTVLLVSSNGLLVRRAFL